MTAKEKANQLEIIFGEMALAVVGEIINSKPSEPKDYSSTIGYWNDVMFFLTLPNQSDNDTKRI